MKWAGRLALVTVALTLGGCAYLDCERQWRESYTPPPTMEGTPATRTDIERGREMMKQDFIRACMGSY